MKIFNYEIKIILAKPYVLAMTVITLLYGWFLLSSETILGVSDTAPFSGWSFGKYLGDAALMSMLASLFLVATVYSKKQKKVGILTDVTGFSARRRMLIKSIIIGGYFLLSNLLLLVLGCVFLKVYFDQVNLLAYMAEYLLVSVPCLLVILGIGNCLGKVNPFLVYVLMAVILVLAFVAPGLFIDTNGANYYKEMSAALEKMNGTETPFVLKTSYLLSRVAYLFIGAVAWIISLNMSEKKRKANETVTI